MLALSLAQLRTQAHRFVATGLAIIIAVGFVVATLVLNESSKNTVYEALSSQYLHTDVVVANDYDKGADAEITEDSLPNLAAKIEKRPGVAAVAIDESAYLDARLPESSGYRGVSVDSLPDDERLRWQTLTDGTWPTRTGEVLAAPGHGLTVGAVVEFQPQGFYSDDGGYQAGRTTKATVVGLTDRGSSIMSIGTQQFWAGSGQMKAWEAEPNNTIRVAAADGTDPEALRQRLEKDVDAAGLGLSAWTGEEYADQQTSDYSDGTAGLTAVLLVFAAIAVFVCALVIANTFAVLLTQRVRELALLRAIGASGKQLRRGVLAESFVVGLVSSALGVAGGIGLAAAVSALAAFYDTPIPLSGIAVTARPVLIGLALGTVVTVVSALFPAWKATRVAPMAAMRPMDAPPVSTRGGLLRRILGLLVLVPAVLMAYRGGREEDLLLAVGGGMLTFLAALLLARWLVPLAVSGVGRLIGPLGQVPGKLAALNATRNPQRTAATATALIIGVTLTSLMVVSAATVRATAMAEIDDAFPTDVIVSGNLDLNSDGSMAAGLPERMPDAVAKVPDVVAAVPVLTAALDQDGDLDSGNLSLSTQSVNAVDAAGAKKVVRTSGDTPAQTPPEGTVSLPDYYAHYTDQLLEDGDPITVTAGGKSLKLTVHLDNSLDDAWISSADMKRLGADTRIEEVWARLADDLSNDERADVLNAISDAAADVDPASSLDGIAEDRAMIDQLITILLMIVLGLLAVAVVIAVIGVGNTMALSVLERRRESGVLRALGLTRGQLRWMLLWEAMLIAGVAAAIGIALGTTYGVLGVRAALGGDSEIVRVDIPVAQLLAILAVAVVAGALSSVLPARRAAKISPVAAMASS